MSSSTSSICWPSRYWLKWLAVFLSSLLVGTFLALATRKPPPPPPRRTLVSAYVEVYLRSGTSSMQPTQANLYFGTSEKDISRTNVLRAPNPRTQESGLPIDFVVFPLDKDQKEQTSFHVQVPWPKEKGKKVTITLDQSTHQGSVSVSP